ncbi:uncharacterized protein LOC119075694 [Bradysia coprophila]|uniref:uncharacterized protein LOC119075694 n=1 Tax=Bradysia coprophila TaxID=38358 RepID=UPI00187D8929|nr:uncharacterized protein LOC119075694 [Bradysia coprophila]
MSTMLFASLLLLFSGICFEVSGLRCWVCRSDEMNASFCGDYFDKDLISDQQRSYVYVNCSRELTSMKNPHTIPEVPVCRLIKQTENMTTVIYRGCHFQQDGLPRDCLHKKYPDGIRTDYCLTCSTDGCNAALDYDLLKKSLLTSSAVGMTNSLNILLIFVLIFDWLF